MITVTMPQALRIQILREAHAARPGECCGLIEGVRGSASFEVAALHPARNLAASPDRFDVDPRDHRAAHKAARAQGRAIIGC
jgi:proteasome lid subunit RPN8/RPN11